jgi:hypothetical protein
MHSSNDDENQPSLSEGSQLDLRGAAIGSLDENDTGARLVSMSNTLPLYQRLQAGGASISSLWCSHKSYSIQEISKYMTACIRIVSVHMRISHLPFPHQS